jgi:hypothetical protein
MPEIKALADVVHPIGDLGASISSGSFKTRGMIVAPCSMRSLAEIASGATTTLLTRAADVCLKERRRLVLLTRDRPFARWAHQGDAGGDRVRRDPSTRSPRPSMTWSTTQWAEWSTSLNVETGLMNRWTGDESPKRIARTPPRIVDGR